MTDSFDVAIVGGGFSGLALARESVFHGFRTVLVEAGYLCGGTSANSLRIVHGGFRYLQSGSIDRVLQSSRAQRNALLKYPNHVRPLPCLMPLQACGLRSQIPVSAALAIYHVLARVPAGRHGAVLSTNEAEAAAPCLKTLVPRGALQWWDAIVTNPLSLAQEITEEAKRLGADIRTQTKAQSVKIDTQVAQLIAHGPEGQTKISARVIINAAGPWIREVEVPGIERRPVNWCRGYNLVFRTQLDPTFAIAGHGRGRLLFAVPRESGSAIGTWYLPMLSDDRRPRTEITEAEIASALIDVRAAFPGFPAQYSEVLTVECGILPTVRCSSSGEPIPLDRERLIIASRYAELVSTKFTTFEVQAVRVLRALSGHLQ